MLIRHERACVNTADRNDGRRELLSASYFKITASENYKNTTLIRIASKHRGKKKWEKRRKKKTRKTVCRATTGIQYRRECRVFVLRKLYTANILVASTSRAYAGSGVIQTQLQWCANWFFDKKKRCTSAVIKNVDKKKKNRVLYQSFADCATANNYASKTTNCVAPKLKSTITCIIELPPETIQSWRITRGRC